MRVNTLQQKLAIEQQAEKARQAIAKRYPDIEIEVFYNEADYHRAIGEADQSKGTYFNNKVYINLTRATETTVAHEVFHGILYSELKNNAQVQALMNRFVDSLSRSQDPSLVAVFAEEVAKVERYKDVQNEEIMAELFGVLAGEYKRLRPQTKSLINRFLERVAKFLGLKKFTDAEVIDVLNTLAGKIATGQEVTTEDVSIISSVDNGTMQENTYLETDGIVVQTPSKRSSLINANIKASDLLDTADIAGKPLEVVYYDNFTSMPYSLRNRVSGSVLNRQGEGGPGYSYRKVIKDNKIIGAFTTVTKGLNLIQGIRSRNEVAKETAVLGIALQNKETGHLGNKTTSRDFYHPTEGVIAQSVNDGVITNKQAVNMLKEAVDAYSKTSKGKDSKSSLGFTSQDFSSLDQFFELIDNISFERRGTFNSTIIPSKADLKITKATKPHTKMWIDSGVPTLRDYNEATAEPYTKNAKSHDVVKYLDPDINSIGIDGSVEVSDAERKRAEEMGVKIVRIDDKASHTSYPVVLFGKNIGIPKFFHSLRDMANEWDVPNPFFKAGRRKDTDTPKRIPEGLESERKADVTKKKQVSGRPSIDEVRQYAKENKISDADVRTFLKEVGYTEDQIKVAMKKAPSVDKILGKKPIKKTVDTYAALKDQIRLESRAAREAQRDLNTKRKDLASMIKDLAGKGVITANQSTVLINRVSSVNLNNERSVEKLVEYMDKVYQNAEYADNILRSNKGRKRAKKNIRSKIGSANVVFNTLNKLFSIDAKLIPQDVLDTYNDLVNQFGGSRAVLNLEDISVVNEKANSILEAIDNEVSEIPKLQLLFEGLNKVIVKGKEDFSETIDQALAKGEITKDDHELMKKYKKDIVPAVDKVEVEAEPITFEFKENNIEDSMENEGAERLIELLKNKKAVDQLRDDLKKNIQAVIDNIDAGFFPSYANNIANEIESIIAKDNVVPRIKKGKYVFDRVAAKINKLFSPIFTDIKRSTTEYQIRQNPLSDIDNVLGNMNRTDIYDNIFGKAAKSYANLDAQIDIIHEKIAEADALLFKQFKRNGNKVTESKFRIMAYMLEREFQSNKDSNKVFSAEDAIKAAIESKKKGDTTIYSKKDIKILESILKEFEGDVNLDSVFNKFSKREKKAISIIDDVNKSIADKALYTASVIRGARPNMIENYVHHSVASSNENTVESITSKYNQFKTFSTKAGTLVERTPGVKPLNFDVLNSTLRGAKETLTDYHMTDTARVIFKTLNKIQADILADENSTDRQIETANALKKAFDTAMRQVFEMNYVNNGMNFLGKAKGLGYKALLASVPRAAAEMSSNFAYVLSTSPKSWTVGAKYREYTLDQRGRDIMINLNSEQTGKLYSKKVTGKTADVGLFVDSEGATPTGAVNGLQNKANQILSYLSKVTIKPTEKIAESLISTPDRAISRPLWFGSLDTKFKEITGKKIDMEAIRNGDKNYLKENKEALKEATRFADKEVTRAATSINVFNGVLKNKIDPNDSSALKIIREINGFMTNFMIYEYTTARSAISAMINSGQISRQKGASLLLGTTARMSLYMVLYQAFSHLFDSVVAAIAGADIGDEEMPEEDLLARQLVGSIVSLIVGKNLGNFAKIVPNISLEVVNEKYLEDLRNGEDYDPYKHSIAYSMLSREDLKKIETGQAGVGDVLLKAFSGPYSPTVKTLTRAGKLVAKVTSEKSKDATKQKAIEELNSRIVIEMLGNMGMIPFYKDVRRIVIKDFFNKEPELSGYEKMLRKRSKR
jgi:RNAse (barnase) inhibitor barstar